MQWSDIPRNPSPTMLRQFSTLWLAFFGGLAVWQGWGHGRVELAWCLATAAVVISFAGLVHPPMVRWLFVGWTMAVFPIGWLVSRIVLSALFYGVFTPLAAVFRCMGRDVLRLKRQPEATTYWQIKPGVTDVKRYFQQF